LEMRVWNGMLLLWETHPLEKVRSLFGIEGVGVIGSEEDLFHRLQVSASQIYTLERVWKDE
jgi:hypothetical protein